MGRLRQRSYVAPHKRPLLAAHNGVVIIDVVGSFGESAAETLVRDEQGDIVKRKTLPGAGGLISFPVDDEQVSRLTVSTRFSSLFESVRVALTVPAGDTNPDAPSVKIVVPSTTAPRLEVEGLPGAQVIITDGVTTLASGFIRRGSLGLYSNTWTGDVDISAMTGNILYVVHAIDDAISTSTAIRARD